jgi:hypothetical protein
VTSVGVTPTASARVKKALAAGRSPPCGEHDVDDLAVLVDRPVQVGPPAGDLDVRFVDVPPVARQPPAGTGSLDELGSEPLHPPVDGDVVNGDSAFGE